MLRNALFHPSAFSLDPQKDTLCQLFTWLRENSSADIAEKLMHVGAGAVVGPQLVRPYDAFADHDLAIFAVMSLDFLVRPMLPDRPRKGIRLLR